jgi:glycerol-3-phosphate cytidylyltransferase
MKKGITFGAFDLFHAGHVLMMEEAKSVCDYLIVCLQTDPSIDRSEKNSPVQSILERQIQVEACKYVDEVIIYDTEEDVMEISNSIDWDVRILGDEYKDKYYVSLAAWKVFKSDANAPATDIGVPAEAISADDLPF